MKNVRFFLVVMLFVIVTGNSLRSQDTQIIDVSAESYPGDAKRIIINYTLKAILKTLKYQVSIHVSLDGGKTYSTALGSFQNAEEVGVVKVGKHKAVWNVLDDRPNGLIGDQIRFKVKAVPAFEQKDSISLLPQMVLVKGTENFQYKNRWGNTKTANIKDFYISRKEASIYELFQVLSFWRIQSEAEKNIVERAYNKPFIGSFSLARKFCRRKGGRLPKSSEWLYAAKGGHLMQNTVYPGSNNFEEVGWINNKKFYEQPVALLKPNSLGLFDMLGNAWEWVRGGSVSLMGWTTEVRFLIGGSVKSPVDKFTKLNGMQPFRIEGYNVKSATARLVKSPPKNYFDQLMKVKSAKVNVGQRVFVSDTDFTISKSLITYQAYAQFLNFEGAPPHSLRVRKWIYLGGKDNRKRCRIYFIRGRYKVEKGFEKRPVTFVSHLGARAYAVWRGGRLPTELELRNYRNQAQKGGINKTKEWLRDNYEPGFFESADPAEKNIWNHSLTGRNTIIDQDNETSGGYSNNYFAGVGFRVVLPKEH